MDLMESEIEEAHKFVTEELGRPARFETFSKRIRPTHERLVEAATNSEPITYGELADYAGTDNRHYMSILLDGIGYIKEGRDNPPITVLVVHANDDRPAEDFVDLLDSLGIRHRYNGASDAALVDEVMEEVLSYDWE